MVILCCMMAVIPVMASETGQGGAEQRVYDMAGLFSDTEIADFEQTISEYRQDMKMDVVVVTTEDSEGKSTRQYADDFFEAGGFGYGDSLDGVLFLIDMDNRELTLSVSGETIRLLTDARIESILDDVYEGAASGDYVSSAEFFLEDVAAYHKKGIQANQYNYDTETGKISVHRSIRWYEALLALVIPGIVAWSACAGVISQYSMKKEHRLSANHLMAYRADCQFQYHDQQDNLTNKFVTSRIIPRNHTGGGGMGMGGGSGSGRSSTHRSGSGRSFGGGSRKF